MVDYWVSNSKKFCDFCKCWIADNKPSIQFHERGKNHQANVKQRLIEVKKKSMVQKQQNEDFKNDFAAMEAAALKAVQKDFKNDPSLMGTNDLNTLVKDSNQTDTSSSQQVSSEQPWMICEAQGHNYYYNTVTGESTWQTPQCFKDTSLSTESSSTTHESTNESTKLKIEEICIKEPEKQEEATEEIQEEATEEIQEETDKHPLLGGWTRVSYDNSCTPDVENEEQKETENTSNIPTNEQETDNKTDTTNPEPRTTGRKFKEKKVTSLTDAKSEGENVAFKKRKFGGARNVRRRFDDS